MSLRQDQSDFVKALEKLFCFAHSQGFELTLGEATARDGHKVGSFHYKRLAIDLNLFKDGFYLMETEDHLPLGEYWESIGGTWGGRFKNPDGNHYSWKE